MDKKEVIQDERDRLLYELVIRQSALEKALVKAGVITEKVLAEAQVECMEKLKKVIETKSEVKAEAVKHPGFIKFGDSIPEKE